MSEINKKLKSGIDKAQESATPITNLSESSFFKQLLGFWVTFKAQFKKPNTVQYPEEKDRKSTRLNSSHVSESRMPSSA